MSSALTQAYWIFFGTRTSGADLGELCVYIYIYMSSSGVGVFCSDFHILGIVFYISM